MLTVLTAALQFGFAFNPTLFVVASILFRIAFAAYDGPQTTLISLLPLTEDDAGNYVRLRSALAAVARFAVTIANLMFTGWPASAVRVAATIILVICLLAIVASAALLLRAARLSGVVAPQPHSRTTGELPIGAGRLLISFVLAVAAMPLVSRLLIFAPNGAIPQWGALLLCAFTFGSVVGPLLTEFTETRLGWRRSWVGSIIVAVLAGDALSWTWLWPPLVTVTLALVHGVGLGMMGALQWISASRSVRRYAALTGRRTDGLLFGSVVFTVQCAVAIGALLLGSILDSFAAATASASLKATLIMSISGSVVAVLLLKENPLSTETRGR
jgi:Na+/melibiose symporter-like transporter